MASMFSLIRKGKIGNPAAAHRQADIADIINAQPTLVNISSFVQQCHDENRIIGGDPLDVTPPRRLLWFESAIQNKEGYPVKHAACVERCTIGQPERFHRFVAGSDVTPSEARHHICIALWEEHDGMAWMCGSGELFSDALGRRLDYRIIPIPDFDDDESALSINDAVNVVLEAITVMNTVGTYIDPPLERERNEVIKPDRAPCSIWRTIRIPRFQAPPLPNAVINGPVLERREHWVRAHRADYRDGKGLFGRVKALIWVPEHQRGNPELGTVMQSYRVDAPELKKPPTSETKADSKTKFNH